jgi:hypothetical protein
LLPRISQPNASRRAPHKDDAELFLELPERLADGGCADTQSVASSAKAVRVGDGEKHAHRIQVFWHCEVRLKGLSSGVK